jgi:hypothetical protein
MMDQDNLRQRLKTLLLENQIFVTTDNLCLQKLRDSLVKEPDSFFVDAGVYLSDIVEANKAKMIYAQRLDIAKKHASLDVDLLEKIVDFFAIDAGAEILHLRINCPPHDIYFYFGYSNNQLKLIHEVITNSIPREKFLEVYKHNSS